MKWIVYGPVLPLLFGVSCCSASKNVLVLDVVVSRSHQIWMHRLTRALADHGYNVTTLTATDLKHPSGNLHVYFLEGLYDAARKEDNYNFVEFTQMNPWATFSKFTGHFKLLDKFLLESPALQRIMDFPKDFNFDLLIYDSDYLVPAAQLVLVDRFPKAHLIGASAYPAAEYTDQATKAPHLASFAPNFYVYEVEDTFCSRLNNFLMYFVNDMMQKYKFYPNSEKMIRKYYELKRPLAELIASTTIFLANHNPVLDAVTPIMPSVIPVGGLQIEDPKPLPVDL